MPANSVQRGVAVASRRVGRSRDPFDTSGFVAESAERQYLAGLLDVLDEQPQRARELASLVEPEMLVGDGTGEVHAAVRQVLSMVTQPTRGDVMMALRRSATSDGVGWDADPVRALFVELVADRLVTGWQASRLAEDAAAEIAEWYRRRRSLELTGDFVSRVRDGDDVGDVLAKLSRDVEALRVADVATGRRGVVTFAEAVELWGRHERVPTVQTLLEPLDRATEGGLPVGGLTMFVAPPQAGKSALAVQLSVGALLADGELRAVYGLGEMGVQALARRMACVGASLLGWPAVTMHAAGERDRRARETLGELCRCIGERLSIVEPPLTVERIDDEVQRTGSRLAVVDYLQLVEADGESRVEQLDAIVSRLRDMAIRREAAVVVISSMAKATGTASRIGQFVRGTGEADYAAELLYLGNPDERADEHGVKTVVWECRKARNLPQVDLELRFDGACQTFSAPVEPFSEFSRFEPGAF
jgi:hypothetical protein